MYSSLRNSHYRLSIIYSKLEDSDTYTCVSQVDTVCYITVDIIYNVWSQHGLATSLTVEVTQLQCPPLASLTRYCDLYPLYTDLTTSLLTPQRPDEHLVLGAGHGGAPGLSHRGPALRGQRPPVQGRR